MEKGVVQLTYIEQLDVFLVFLISECLGSRGTQALPLHSEHTSLPRLPAKLIT